MTLRIILSLMVLGFCLPSVAVASDPHAPVPEAKPWNFRGAFGTYDRAALQRGYKIYKDVCAACHSMDLLYYRNLEGIGYNEEQIKNIAAQYTVVDGPNDEGEMFERAGLPSDPFKAPFANVKEAQYANGGAYPPDLSLIAKARVGGSDYIYALLTGYKNPPPHGVETVEGKYWNTYFPGHNLSMAPPLSDGMVAYEDESTPETVEQYAQDVSHFLMWAADPYMEERKRTGWKVLMFLAVFAAVMYVVKKKVWTDQH